MLLLIIVQLLSVDSTVFNIFLGLLSVVFLLTRNFFLQKEQRKHKATFILKDFYMETFKNVDYVTSISRLQTFQVKLICSNDGLSFIAIVVCESLTETEIT
mmetsp:Transcript_1693/g.1751  ORF Transcript_1693/g.1751 Transcript_1693/m.1751 type:complete len:101 (+) Transcript_1693:227-529(+)